MQFCGLSASPKVWESGCTTRRFARFGVWTTQDTSRHVRFICPSETLYQLANTIPGSHPWACWSVRDLPALNVFVNFVNIVNFLTKQILHLSKIWKNPHQNAFTRLSLEASWPSWQLEVLTFLAIVFVHFRSFLGNAQHFLLRSCDGELRPVVSCDGPLRVLEDGLATVWNINNPTRVIAAGDRILEVNGEALSPEDWLGRRTQLQH